MDTFQKPLLIEDATIGANKVLCLQGEVLEAQVEWTRLEPDHQRLFQVDYDTHFNMLTSRCFECGCMVDLLASYEGVRLLHSIDESTKYISLTATGYYLPQSFESLITSLECNGIPNWFLSVLLIRNVTQSDARNYEVTVRSARSMLLNYTTKFYFTLNIGMQNNFIVLVLALNYAHFFYCTHHIDYLQKEPIFHHGTAVNSRTQTTQYIAEGITTYYICNATIPVSSFLMWRRLDIKTIPTMKHVTLVPLNSVVHNINVNELCQAFAEVKDTISLTISNSTLYTSEGLVRQQIVALVICNMKSSTVGIYQCIAQSSIGEVASGPQISKKIIPSVSSPSRNNNMLVPYLAMGCALITILLFALLVIVITYFWLRYQSKHHKPGNTVTHRRTEENIYYPYPHD